MPLASGTRLGPYEIVAGIGSGGMGEVYRARDTRLQRDVAIKTLPAGVADDPGRRARFEREAQTISRLSHPNICAIYDIGNVGDVAFLVMEYIEGESLANRLRLGPIPWSTALPWAIEVASAIDAAHRRGIVHRDLKPANIMVGESGVKLLDFGVAKLLEKQDAGNLAETASLTREHQIVGTIHYMSPEQLEGRDIDPRTDIFAFGATLYEMLTARHAFEGTTLASVTTAVLTAEPAPIATSGATDRLPRGLEHVIRRALAKNPADRWQTSRDLMIELKAVLDRALRERPMDDLPESARQPAARRAIRLSPKTLAVAASLLIGAGATGWCVTSSRPITLAVVPTEAATGIPDIDALDDGITENIINKLGEATPGRLSVIALSSVRRYKGAGAKFDAQSAGRELGADMLLILRITQGPEKLSIAPELIRASNGTREWSFTYETTMANLFAAEERIAKDTLEQLHIRLNDEERRQLGKRDTENMDAYLQYLTGWALVDRQANTEVNYEQSIKFFEKATAIDPKYAAAYVGIAIAYQGLGWEGFLPPKDARTLSQEALEKAQSLGALAVEALPQAGGMHALYQWDFEATERAARRAIALRPEDPLVHKFWALQLRSMGRWNEALAAGRKALKHDPLGVQSNSDLATTYAWQGDLTRAIEQYRITLTLDRRAGTVHELLADAYARTGNYDQAIAEMREALTLAELPPAIAAALGADYVTLGYDAAIQNLYRGQLHAGFAKEKAGEYVSPLVFAQIYAHLHENDKAFEYLDKALKERQPWLAFLKHDPSFAPLRKDPRFSELVKVIGIPDASWLRERWLGLLARLGLD